jgi:hypothetical protein
MYSLLFSSALAFAAEPVVPTAPVPCGQGTTEEHAEYQRLSMELEKLAGRNAWTGVERTFHSMVDTHVCLTFENWMIGAHAARGVGDITSARQRLYKANEVKSGEREVLDWLWDIDSNYGVVFFACDPGRSALSVEAMPFDPVQAKAVEFAIARVTDDGLFEGYLPQGNYVFGSNKVIVQARVQATRIDLRSDDPPRREKKKKKEKEPVAPPM